MKRSFILILACWSVRVVAGPGTAAAQRPDSVQAPTLFSFYQQLYSAYEHTAGQVLFHPSDKYGFSSAGFSATDGDWRTYQMPASSNTYHITSKGAYTLKKVKLSGAFAYKRRLEDSVGWMLKPDHHDTSPYYLASKKPGNWDAHTYELKGAASIPVAGVVFATAGAALTMGNYGRFNDPRPEISRYRLKFSGGLGLQFEEWAVVLSGIYGYGDERNSIGYANKMNNTIGRPDYVSHDIMGYGYYRTTGTALRLQEDQHTKGAALVLQVSSFNLSYSLEQAVRKYSRRTKDSNEAIVAVPIADVTQDRHALRANYSWESEKLSHLLDMALTYEQTSDFNKVIINGNNYRGTAFSVTPAYHARFNDWEYSLSSNLTRDTRKDGTAAVDYAIQTAAVAAGGGKLFHLGNNLLKLNLQAAYRTDMGSELNIGTQYNTFMKGVILPDFAYYSAEQLRYTSSLGFGLKVQEVVLMPYFDYSLVQPLQTSTNPYADFNPAHSRSTYTFGLNIHM
ncbi:DUF6850 family outer membrane beta-barrel protein [Pontibacter actiniarum]|uniref:DUF6850 domain-containing protein n=1 Tax=Pontibacter actiniarum TaxID=323450 RepID=A0A1X9YRG1_9BACT|nr:DUF6850 family outer membrane beta-barrel protein [Pontibacter actiniarum]ARS35467.1 hypothetical protein CA264_08455 [Pontibacter actiniarum]